MNDQITNLFNLMDRQFLLSQAVSSKTKLTFQQINDDFQKLKIKDKEPLDHSAIESRRAQEMANLISHNNVQYIDIKTQMTKVLSKPEPNFSKYPKALQMFFAKRMKTDVSLLTNDDDPMTKKVVKVM
jgi:hypothetical protein